MNKKALYEKIINDVAKIVKKTLNEYKYDNIDYDKFNIDTQKLGNEIQKPLNYKYTNIANKVQKILDNMHKQYRFKEFLTGFATEPRWADSVATACTDMEGMLVFNPEFAQKIYDIGVKAVEFAIMHEAMHNYLKNKGSYKQKAIGYSKEAKVNNNVQADEEVNAEILRRWPEYKEYAEKLHAIQQI